MFLYIVDWGFLKNEITLYTVSCPQDYNGCYALSSTRYKINRKSQEVIYLIDGQPLFKYTDCAIQDRNNWKCTYDDDSGEFGFTKGEYFFYDWTESNLLHQVTEGNKYVSKIEYLLVQFGLLNK